MSAGCVVWFTGLPASGKTTLAEAVQARLHDARRPCVLLDGDAVRAVMVPRPGYDPASRDAFYASLAGLAGLLARQGLVVLVAATAHLSRWRARAHELAPRFLEVYVDANPDDCQRRDPKGLYAAARAGKPDVPGAGVPYEAPIAPDVVARGGLDHEAADEVATRVT
jgi:adenylylsulfate kinase